ncbi:hypothetical protein KQX54_018091 [Cotesia glomerata]|uniref:Uncharacterized protein n=1 Tax=Cotesia glomerata TaxID=32391 RepID=A0AAV7I460_COTGL|nr:hypothetical protein KQX54_018091 [Cotesia glomerata]
MVLYFSKPKIPKRYESNLYLHTYSIQHFPQRREDVGPAIIFETNERTSGRANECTSKRVYEQTSVRVNNYSKPSPRVHPELLFTSRSQLRTVGSQPPSGGHLQITTKPNSTPV